MNHRDTAYGPVETDPRADETSLGQEAEQALDLANQLHQALDDLEQRLFPIGPQEVTKNGLSDVQIERRIPLSDTVRHIRESLDHATSRLSRIVPRI